MMKLLKRAATAALSLAVAVSALPLDTASAMVAENQKYADSVARISEDFETLTAEDLQAGRSPVVQGFINNPEVTIGTLPSGSGKFMGLKSTNTTGDGGMRTKAGLFKYDITVVDVYLRLSPTAGNSLNGNYGRVTLRDESSNNNQILVDYQETAKVRSLYDSTHVAEKIDYRFIPYRFILNRSEKTITVTSPQATVSGINATKTLDWISSGNLYLHFQSFGTKTSLGIDDITISDGFYLENDYMNEDFEHVKELTVNSAVSLQGFLRGGATTQVTYDSNTKNTYLSFTTTAANATPLYTASNTGIRPTAGTPTVISFRLKTDVTSTFTAGVRINSVGSYLSILAITNGVASAPNSGQAITHDVSDGNFHTYRMVITPNAEGDQFTVSLTVDGNVWLGSLLNKNNITSGARFDIRGAANGITVGLDDFHVFQAEAPKLRGKFENTNVGIDSSLTFESNNPVHYGSLTPDAFTLTEAGTETTVAISKTSNTGNNTFALAFAEDLKPNTTYTLAVADGSKFKTMYDQFYSGPIASFTTGDEPAPSYRFTYTVNGEEVSGTDCLAAGTLGITLDVRAYSAGANTLAIAALYDDSEQLIKTEVLRSILDGAGTDTQTGSLTIGEDELSGAKVKLFLWNGATYSPIREAAVLTPDA